VCHESAVDSIGTLTHTASERERTVLEERVVCDLPAWVTPAQI
jgi:hypothetical protein